MNIVEETEESIPADAWASVIAGSREALRLELSLKTIQFKLCGGKIEEVAHGATGLSDGLNLSFPRGLSDSSKESEELARKRQRYTQASMASRLKRDEESVEALRRALPQATSLTDLAKRLGVTPPRAGRFLKAFFKDDPLAQRFIPMDRDGKRKAYEAEMLPKLRQAVAEGMIGISYIAKSLGLAFETVAFMDKQYNLGIPRGNGKNKRKYQKQFVGGEK